MISSLDLSGTQKDTRVPVLSLVISFLLEIIDTTIKPGDDLYKMYDIPVFAEIVDFETEGGGKKR